MTDEECLEYAIDLALKTPEDVRGRHDQIHTMLAEDRDDAALFCVFHMQCDKLGLRPWELPPMDCDGTDNGPMGRLVRRLEKHGISKYHPDPLAALKAVGAGNGLK
jgi:hypothetical protein